ncbi:hypothetical protein H6P81_001095 [Aristolochia fimbriata]|uniref:Uncharacterized protein n=1 Tax=Aristolochia fimbriata TaxID=158543 RepID=A0AAV7F9X6_ARIFI|nr:hypothetical protein H6P81_001095 [Aristolochia fimbriata]
MAISVNLFHLFLVSLATKYFMLAATKIGSSPLDRCPEQCGDVKIIYPFGAAEGCFLPGFEIICNGSTPYLAGSSFQLLEILQGGQVRIKSNPAVASFNHKIYGWANSSIRLDDQSPYTVSFKQNRFVAVGCGTWGSLWSSTGSITTSCVAKCEDQVEDGSCTGNGCCEASMPRIGKVVNMVILYYRDMISYKNYSLGYGFIVEKGGYNFNASDLWDLGKSKNISMRLDWAIGEADCSQAAETESYKCGQNSSCVDSGRGFGYLCECLPGYDGNPYLNGSLGCQDINECDLPREDPCVPQATCRNIVQGFSCVCPDGIKGDGVRNGTGCKKQFPLIPMILGIIAGVALIIVCFSFWISRKKKNLIKLREVYFHNNGGTLLQHHFDDITDTSTGTQVKIFPADELKKGTNNYSSKQLLSRDGRDKVYKGKLQDGSMVALIKLRLDQRRVDKFVDELIALSKIDHKNIVKFLGCCLETQVPTLVYEFIPGGTLYDRLHGSSKINLSWKHTLQIAVEMADAVSYLYSFTSGTGSIRHTHITSSGVLLHEHSSGSGNPRDFQLSKLLLFPEHEASTIVKGGLGYLDPEYFQTGIESSKSDVYSFGVLLLELLLCQKPVQHGMWRDCGSMVLQFISLVESEKLFEDFGRAVANRGTNPEQLQAMAHLAKNCLNVKGDQRPTMQSVLNELASLSDMAISATFFSFQLTLLIAALYLPLHCGAHKSSALPGCPDACGDVSISYPFGIGEGCFLPGFEVQCVENVPSLPQADFQILELLPGEVRVNSSYLIDNTCDSSPDQNEGTLTVSLPENCPYTLSSSSTNRLFVVGCNITGVAIHGITGTSTCTTFCHGGKRIKSGSCKGEGCCETPFVADSKLLGVGAFGVDLEKSDLIGSSCGRAFVAEEGDYTFAESDLWNFSIDGSHLRMRLEWAIGEEEDCNKVENMACLGNSSCIESKRKAGYICQCMDGFEGNPYLTGLQGCQDIDECQTFKHNCASEATCRNQIPGFDCNCPQWSSGDGRLNGTGCHKNFLVREAALATVVVGGIAFISVSYWGLKKRRHIRHRQEYFQKNGGLFLQHYFSYSNRTAFVRLNIFSAEELAEATNNYNRGNIIDLGGPETLYRGTLKNGTVVVIKVADPLHPNRSGKFVDEIVMLTQINHDSIIKVLGCCLETQFPLVVYEFFANDTLYSKLHRKVRVSEPLKWKERLHVAAEIAEALVYLHSFASMPIIHGDVKSSNVLLDADNNVKIADFGDARLVSVSGDERTALVKGTIGYLDPEYYRTRILTEKSDVYSFGVVLIELLAGSKPFLHEVTQEYASLVMHFRTHVGGTYLLETLDEGLLQEAKTEELLEVADIANKCLAAAGEERPPMTWVHKQLTQVGISNSK